VSHLSRVTRLAGAGAVAFALSATGAQAAPPVSVDAAESGTFDDCGFVIAFDFTTTFSFFNREIPGTGGQAFAKHQVSQFRNVLTNPATGQSLVLRGHEIYLEMTARQLDGNVFEFTSQTVGQPFVIENSDGKVVLRDRGRSTSRFLFDTLGDGQPGGELLEEQVTGVSGPHPSFDAGFDFCAIATELIG
jgi:hypothetical protein